MQAKKVSNTEAASSSEKALVPHEDIKNEENEVDTIKPTPVHSFQAWSFP